MHAILDAAATFLNAAGVAFWRYALAMLVQTAALVIFLLILDLLLRRRVRAVFRYCVWLLVLIKLMLPPTVSLPTGIGYWFAGDWRGEMIGPQATPVAPPVSVASAESIPLPSSAGATHFGTMEPSSSMVARGVPASESHTPLPQSPQRIADPTPSLPQKERVSLTWQSLLVALWLMGVIALSAFVIHRALLAYRLVERATPPDERFLAVFDECRRRVNVRRPVRLGMTDELGSPAVCGILHPFVLLPHAIVSKLDATQLRAVLIHELTHVVRGDLAVQAVQTVLQVLHFYNPFVWVANAIIRRTREQAVDEGVLIALGREPSEYSHTLIEVAGLALRRPAMGLGLIGVVESKSALAGRIRHILARPMPRSARLGLTGAAAVLVLAATTLPMAGAPPKNAASPTEKSTINGSSAPETKPPAFADPTDAVAVSASQPAGSRGLDLKVGSRDTGLPLSNVEVQIRGQREKHLTDAFGRRRIDFPDKEPEYLAIDVSKVGYAGMRAVWDKVYTARGIPAEFTIALERGISIGGTVQDEAGKPIADVKVTLILPSTAAKTGHLVYPYLGDHGIVRTDANGRWHCDVLPATFEHVDVLLSHPDYLSDTQYRQRPTPPIGALRNLTAVMVMNKGMNISGVVRNNKGEPIAGANVSRNPNKRVVSWYRDIETDNEGRFAFKGVPPGQVVITVEAKGYSPSLTTLDIEKEPEPLDIALEPGHTIRVRVVDVNGKPVEGVWAWSRHWRNYASFCHESTTNAEGRFELPSAPADEVLFEMGKEGYIQIWDHPITAGDETVLTLKPVLHVHGKVLDAETGEPILNFRLVPGYTVGTSRQPDWDHGNAKTFPDSEYQFAFDFPRDGYAIRVEAEGHAPANSPVYKGDEGQATYDFKLRRMGDKAKAGLTGTVRDAAGKPIAGAQVALSTKRRKVYVQNGKRLGGQDYPSATTVADGTFSIGLEQTDYTAIVVIADQGFAVVKKTMLTGPIEIRVEPWGRIEGMLKIGAKPAPNQTVILGAPWDGVILDYSSGTDGQGSFEMKRVPVGHYTVGRDIVLHDTGQSSLHSVTHVVPVDVNPDQTAHVTIGGTGRPLIGNLKAPEGATRRIDWTWGNSYLELTPQVRYVVKSRSDGSFRAEDIPAGTYKLSIVIREPSIDNDGKVIGQLTKEVVVPEMPSSRSDEPLDVGTLILELQSDRSSTQPGKQSRRQDSATPTAVSDASLATHPSVAANPLDQKAAVESTRLVAEARAPEIKGAQPSPAGSVAISGTVKFLGGAPKQGFEVSARSATGDYSGFFVFPDKRSFELRSLPSGLYEVSFKSPEFDTKVLKDVQAPTQDLVVEIPYRGNPTIKGEVIEAATGQPIRRFKVRVCKLLTLSGENYGPDDEWRSFSSDSGEFEVDTVGPGIYEAQIAAEGFAWALSRSINTVEDKDARVRVELKPGVTLTGRVTDEAGRPISGAKVIPLSRANGNMGTMLVRFVSDRDAVLSKNDGRFAIEHLGPGRENLKVMHPDYAASIVQGLEIEENATPAPVPVTLKIGGTVAGQVFDAERQPQPNIKLEVQDDFAYSGGGDIQAGRLATVVTDKDGRYEIQHLAEKLCFINRAPYTLTPGVQRQTVLPRNGQRRVVNFGGSSRITGRLVIDDKPFAKGMIQIGGDSSYSALFCAYATTDENGMFTVRGTPPGRRHLYWADAKQRNEWLEALEFEVKEMDMDLGVITPSQSTVTVNVEGEAPLDMRMSLLQYRPSTFSANPVGRTLPRQKPSEPFVLEGITSGEYELDAWRKDYPNLRQRLTVKPEQRNVTISLHIPTGTAVIEGRVSDELMKRNRPPLRFFNRDLGIDAYVSTGTKEYRLDHLPAGTYSLVQAWNRAGKSLAELTLKPAETRIFNLDAKTCGIAPNEDSATGALRVSVVTAEGMPIPGADVYLTDTVGRLDPTVSFDLYQGFSGKPGEYSLHASAASFGKTTAKVTLKLDGSYGLPVAPTLWIAQLQPEAAR